MSKHTPGPWEIDTVTRPAEICTIHHVPPQGEEKQRWVYVRGAIGYWEADANEQLANARLIAAAPDLLQAAKAVVERWDSPRWKEQEHTGTFIDKLRAAIAKAEGDNGNE